MKYRPDCRGDPTLWDTYSILSELMDVQRSLPCVVMVDEIPTREAMAIASRALISETMAAKEAKERIEPAVEIT